MDPFASPVKPTGCCGLLPIFIIEDMLHFTLRLVKIKMFYVPIQVHVPCELAPLESPCSCIAPLQFSLYSVPFYILSPWHSHCHHHISRHCCCFPNSHKRLHWSPTLSSIFCPADGVVFLKHTSDYVISSSNSLWLPLASRIKSRFLRSSFRALHNLAFSALITYYTLHLLDLSRMNCYSIFVLSPSILYSHVSLGLEFWFPSSLPHKESLLQMQGEWK